jgi:uncharacterized protein YjbI with pentapeptide repeats
VKLVVLSACYSELQAQALTAHVACVVGMAGSIRDDATRYFAIGLYGGLGECESVATAFRQGLAAMRLKGIAQCSSTVHLLTSPDTDASKVYIVEAQNKRRRCSIVIKATLNEFDTEVIARVRDQLRLLSGDLTLEITDVREGSVILEIALSSEAAERLEELSERGELTHVLGFEVSSIRVREISAEVRSAVAHNDPDPDVDSSLVLRAGANLTGKDLRGSDLRAAQLTGARLARANLTDATLIRANLRSANLCGATLQGAQLDDADLHRANLIGANLAGANLTHVNLSRADLTGADLTGADLTAADLTHADFTAANLTLANLTNATLTGADLTLANLTNATLTGADLTHANLTNATLSHVKVARANVRHADVADVVPYGTNVSGADHSDTWDRGALVGLVEADRWTDDWPEGTVPESDQGRTIGWAPVPTAPPSTASTDSPPLPPADSPPSTSKKGAT